MKWYRKLYIGETAEKKKRHMIAGMKRNHPPANAYYITLALNGTDLLDIYAGKDMCWKYFRKTEIWIIGIANGYHEAVGLACQIVTEIYKETGSFHIKKYILEENRTVPFVGNKQK